MEVSEEALAESLLHHLRRMKKHEDFLARVKDGLNNRLGVNPSRQKVSVQAGPECFNRITLEEKEREGPTSVPPDDGLIVATPATLLLLAQPQALAQAHQQHWRVSPGEEVLTNSSYKEDSAATSSHSSPSLPCPLVELLQPPFTLMESGYSTSGAEGCIRPSLSTPRLPGNRAPSGPATLATSEVMQGNSLRPEAAGSCQSQALAFLHPEASSILDHHLPEGSNRNHPSSCCLVFAPYALSEGLPLEEVAKAAEVA